MDKRAALKILIEHTFVLDDDAKVRLVDSIPKLTDEEVDQLGILLATEKKIAIEKSNLKLSQLTKTINKLSQLNPK